MLLKPARMNKSKPGKPSDADVFAEPGFDFFRPPQKQLSGDAAIVENLLVQFDAELVAGRILP